MLHISEEVIYQKFMINICIVDAPKQSPTSFMKTLLRRFRIIFSTIQDKIVLTILYLTAFRQNQVRGKPY